MAGADRFTAETCTEQWLFDYLIYKCVSKSAEKGEVDDSSRRFLEALMLHTIDPDYGMNEIKANLLIVMDYQLQLTDLNIDNLHSSKSDKLLESEKTVTEFFEMMSGLKNSLICLKESFELKSTPVFALCKSCLLHTYVNILQIIYRLRNSPEPLYDASELKSWTGTILKKAEKNVDLASETDAKILQACKDLFKGNSTVKKDLPNLTDFVGLLDKLVKELHGLFGEPQILKLAKSYSCLHSKLKESGNEDLLTRGPSSKSSLEKLSLFNDSSSGEEGRSSEGTSTRNGISKMALSHGQPGRRARSRTGPSSDDRSESEEILSRPRKGRDEQSRSRSPHKRPGVSKVVQKFREMEKDWNPKSIKQLSRKPASHARIKIGPWTPEEEEKFVLSVLRIGVGKWVEVKEDIQALRSSVQLKDKWRNIPKSRIKSIAREHSLPPPP
ncbi:hypothetical protein RRG08_037256 [Elysia crispata]|uniref:Telomeric repeat-binding factor n=1 Tax=Elysia crispata TaxID=231223 RepID=A0AAE0YM10_9GAST|nr:hypothetical protein RRG08_037256 [Elysia crispata]